MGRNKENLSDRKALAAQLAACEARYRAVAESNFVPLVFWDAKGCITDANQAFLNLLGYTREQLLSSRFTLFDLTPPALRFADYHALADLEAGKAVRPYEKEMYTRDHRPIPVLAGAGCFGDGGGVGFVLDLSERKDLERRLNESRERLFLAQQGNAIGTFEWNLVTNQLEWSQELENLYGLDAGAFDGSEAHWQRMVNPDDWRQLQGEVRGAMRHFRGNFHAEFQILHASGEPRWIEARGHIIYSIGSTPIRISGIQQDITPRKETEIRLARAQAQLEAHARDLEARVEERTAKLRENLQTLESLTYTIAHDLRAPLRAMQGFAAALNEEFAAQLGPVGESYTRRIRRACMRMDTLVTDLLSYARIGHTDVPLQPVDLADLFSAFAANHADTIASQNALIEVREPLPSVLANKTLLPHVIENLMLNALKFVAPDSRPEVRVWAEQANGTVRVNIKDNGIGIEPQYHGKIFEIFQRLHAPEEYSGTGVGLAIVKKAVERMNGSVGLESQRGSGTRFWIELPAAPARDPDAEPPHPTAVPSNSSGSA